MGRRAEAKLFWGVVVDLEDVPAEVVERLELNDDLYGPKVDALLDPRGLAVVWFKEGEESRHGIYAGPLHRASWGYSDLPPLAPTEADFAGALAALGLPPQEPRWVLVGTYS